MYVGCVFKRDLGGQSVSSNLLETGFTTAYAKVQLAAQARAS